mmetsp:Transcript_17245/g.47774  ORF Transcript_17245/g.47774 Transcript_17245/m.47774 type:complete len:80 (-) Transcript_17245:144-383(-)|eukprot:CAMPEP_0198117782 /NCGR_PEP_ID=MMETSP1442-20131203/19259_1 /TAXON_ID= /ORGANISM="Craspedostauros australis, Strain CCMP3328" /LENGTH=79 /DNA_ID=CAMNT_0043775905 /DNA_START=1444 /DNA_END=1683 /DNA_ORIENTATION=+
MGPQSIHPEQPSGAPPRSNNNGQKRGDIESQVAKPNSIAQRQFLMMKLVTGVGLVVLAIVVWRIYEWRQDCDDEAHDGN